MVSLLNPYIIGGPTHYDDFNRADSSSSLGTSSSGHSWTAQQGTWGISSNEGYLAADAGDSQNVATIDCGQVNGIVSVKLMVPTGTDNGLCFRFVDNSNYYIAVWTDFTGQDDLNFYKRLSGTFTKLGGVTTNPVSSGDILAVIMNGDNFDFTINGVSKITFNDTAGSHQGTKHGIRIYGNTSAIPTALNARFDDWSFTP